MVKRRIQIMIDPDLYLKIKARAGTEDKSYSQFIEDALRDKIKNLEKTMFNEEK